MTFERREVRLTSVGDAGQIGCSLLTKGNSRILWNLIQMKAINEMKQWTTLVYLLKNRTKHSDRGILGWCNKSLTEQAL